MASQRLLERRRHEHQGTKYSSSELRKSSIPPEDQFLNCLSMTATLLPGSLAPFSLQISSWRPCASWPATWLLRAASTPWTSPTYCKSLSSFVVKPVANPKDRSSFICPPVFILS